MTKTGIGLNRRQFTAGLGAGLVWPQIGRAAGLEVISGGAFGTTWQMSAPAGSGLESLRRRIEAAFAQVDQQMSPWRPDSEISRFNRAGSGSSLVSHATANVVEASLKLADDSDGLFDPTVGPLVARWGFGPIAGDKVDWRGVSINQGEIAKSEAGLTLDLCGIAKGWALDRAIAIARDAQLQDVLFDLGGELAGLGAHPSGREWQVAVQNPFAGPWPAALRLPSGFAVATSGLTAQSYQLAGKTFGHIIDPKRGEPADSTLKSVSVVSRTAMQADGWATALFAAGASHGKKLAERHGISALFLIRDNGQVKQVQTGSFGELLL